LSENTLAGDRKLRMNFAFANASLFAVRKMTEERWQLLCVTLVVFSFVFLGVLFSKWRNHGNQRDIKDEHGSRNAVERVVRPGRISLAMRAPKNRRWMRTRRIIQWTFAVVICGFIFLSVVSSKLPTSDKVASGFLLALAFGFLLYWLRKK